MNHAAPSSASATSTPEFFFSCHGMARDEFLSCVASKRFRGTVNDGLSATEVRHQGLRRQRWTETVNQIEDGDHRRREHHKIAVAHCVRRIRCSFKAKCWRFSRVGAAISMRSGFLICREVTPMDTFLIYRAINLQPVEQSFTTCQVFPHSRESCSPVRCT
jgi:hypothetical protein